ncbi:MAG TPA: TAXI family TRAP transporter solute-binding subunit [Bdellovibrio sp.]|uniref:TAXI family TRAP transporter solute-binding subunit n=1 Tax=Bdellovibrio sp. TaxID=28201 RepID=UPI002F033172
MDNQKWFKKSGKGFAFIVVPVAIVVIVILVLLIQHFEPAPPNHLTIATGDQVEFQELAKDYQEILKDDGVNLEIRPSNGPFDNLHLLENDSAKVDAAFVQDGLGSPEKQPDVVSLGSLYYEPIWIFYRSKKEFTHLSQLEGKKIAIGRAGHSIEVLAKRLLKMSGVDLQVTKFVNEDAMASAEDLKNGKIDAAFFIMLPDDPLVKQMALNENLRLMDLAQAEAISRKNASFHHLVLPRGAIDLDGDAPDRDINIVASTATLLVRDDLHPALAFLLLRAAREIHSSPGILEKRDEFPMNKDDAFPLSDDALQFYKSGGPFWQRYLPYWLAAWVDRFLLFVIPFVAFVLPLLRLIPRLYNWRLRTRIYQRYGELKFLETQLDSQMTLEDRRKLLTQLDSIEERVNKMRMPRNFSEYIYSLRGHIQFVRDRLEKMTRVES